MQKRWFNIFSIISLVLFGAGDFILKASDKGEGQELHANRFLADALEDARHNYAGRTIPASAVVKFEVYRGFLADINKDGESEYIVAGTITGLDINYVMVYLWKNEKWLCTVLNSGLGGGIADLQLLDVNQDGTEEIYSVIKDEKQKQHCRIDGFCKDLSSELSPMFCWNAEDGMSISQNILLIEKSGMRCVRVDEIRYPESEDGDIKQQTYYYVYENGKFVRGQ
ncbi:MAG TPA: hypothetical protein PLH27_04375 [bacterium]|nr:hypothetical protein [bacterium]HMW35414.1 hypothetical protein [bacterium]HMZ05711.1 hypothetical protein [bacterium]HNB55484.1 hypothetical protein [bacterium]HNC48198.1 hypothetical protein [bacterium]